MLKKLVFFALLVNLLGLLSSPLVYAQTNFQRIEEVDEEVIDDLKSNLEKAKSDSKHLVDGVSKLQNQFGNSDKSSPLDIKQIQQSIDMLLSHYGPMTEKQISDEITANINSNTAKNLLKKYPKIGIFLAKLLKDRNAVKKLFALMTMTEELKKAGLWLLGTFLAGFILNRFLFKANQSFLSKLRSLFIRFLILNGARLAIIVHFYGDNLGPTYKIAKKVFLNL